MYPATRGLSEIVDKLVSWFLNCAKSATCVRSTGMVFHSRGPSIIEGVEGLVTLEICPGKSGYISFDPITIFILEPSILGRET